MALRKNLFDFGRGLAQGVAAPAWGVGKGIAQAGIALNDNRLARKNARIDNQLMQTVGNRSQRDPSSATEVGQLIQRINQRGVDFRSRLGSGSNQRALSSAGSGVNLALQGLGTSAALQAPTRVLPQMAAAGLSGGAISGGVAALRGKNIPYAIGQGAAQAPSVVGAGQLVEVIPNSPIRQAAPRRTSVSSPVSSTDFNPTQNLPWRETTGSGGFTRLIKPRIFTKGRIVR